MRINQRFIQLVLFPALLATFITAGHATTITATYRVTAGEFVDSNANPPPSPATTTVGGDVSFTFDLALPSQLDITPDNITGFDITDRNGVTTDYDETNSAVTTEINIFTDFGRITYGGLFNSAKFMVGLSNDMRVIWDINLTTFEVTQVFENFGYVTTADPFYLAGYTTVELIAVTAVPVGPAAPFFMMGAAMLGMVARRRNKSVTEPGR